MPGDSLVRFNKLPLTVRIRVDAVCCEFEEALRTGGGPKLESYLEQVQGPHQEALFTELLSLELEYRRGKGETPQESSYAGRFHPYEGIVREVFRTADAQQPPLGDANANVIGPHRVFRGATMPPAPVGLPKVPGFELLAELGRGGMGVVYKATQLPLRRLVALKMILAGQFARPDQLLRFVIEGEMLACLRHPNIVQVHEVGQHDGKPFLALEFVDGGTLGDYLASQAVKPGEAARFLEQLARAVHYAHLQGIIHRDLKPTNILLARSIGPMTSGDGREVRKDGPQEPGCVLASPKITDFGLARSIYADVKLTSSGLVAGTPSYMSPEQARGEKNVGPAVDVYALGAILYEMLSGRPPFKAETPIDTIQATLEQEAARPSLSRPGIPIDLETICLKCLEKEPTRRYPSAEALAEDLRRWLAGEPITARPVSTLERLWKWSRRHPGLAGSLAVIASLIVSIAIGSAVAATVFERIAREKGELADQRQIERNKALKAQDQAEQASAEARRQEQAERWERYRANIMTAASALELNNTTIAQQALASAPQEHRNWEWRYLESQLDRASANLSGQLYAGARLRDIPVSPDGRQVAIWSEKDRTVRVWDVPAGKEMAALPHAAEVHVLAFRPDGGQIAIGSQNGSVRLWEPFTNRPPINLAPYPSQVCELVYSPDGRQLLARDFLNSFRLWEATTGKQIAALGDEKTRCIHALFTPDSRRLVADHGKDMWLLDATTGQKVALLASHDHAVERLLLSPDGSRVASQCMYELHVHLWDVASGKKVAVLRGHKARLDSSIFSPDGGRFATGGTYPDNTIRLWDTATGKSLAVLSGHKNSIVQLQFRPDGRRLASVSDDNTVRLWDGLTGQPVATLSGHTGRINQVAFSADSRRLVTAASDRTLRLWDAQTGDLIAVLRGHTGDVWGCAFVAGTKFLISAAADRSYRIWDIALAERTGILRGHKSFVYDVAFRPDGEQVASAAWDGTARLWDPVTGQQSAQLQHANSVVCSLAYRPDGKQLATVSFDNQLHLWDVDAAKEMHTIRLGNPEYWPVPHRPAYNRQGNLLAISAGPGRIGLRDPVTARLLGELQPPTAAHSPSRFYDLAFRPDGTQLAAGGDDGLIHVWDVLGRVEIATLSGHSQPVYRLTFSADGSVLASGALDLTVGLWDTKSFRELGVLPCDSYAYGLAFMPDGTRLAVGCADHTIRLWDVARRQQAAELRGHEAYVHALAFSPDGTQLVSASGDWTVRIWDSLKPAQRSRHGHP
jgi:WD40 repeat protein/serine/threonine protein kinase